MSDDSTNLRQEFVTELESILESDEAYGSNLQILTYALKEDVINGKFKDSWNNRVYEFIIDIDGISYKPAAKLDFFASHTTPQMKTQKEFLLAVKKTSRKTRNRAI